MIIGNYDVEKLLVDLYIDHFARKKDNIQQWEKERSMLHNSIFYSIGLDRHSKEGQDFSVALDKYCEPKIAKYDKFVVLSKKLVNAKTDKEIKKAELELRLEIEKKKFSELSGTRDKPVCRDKVNICRVCKKELVEKIPRVNDHMAVVRGFDEVDLPICMYCSDNNPDEYNVAFRKQYWKH